MGERCFCQLVYIGLTLCAIVIIVCHCNYTQGGVMRWRVMGEGERLRKREDSEEGGSYTCM